MRKTPFTLWVLFFLLLLPITSHCQERYGNGVEIWFLREIQFDGLYSAPPVSASGDATIYYNASDNKLYMSKNGAAYAEVGTGGAGYTDLTEFIDQTPWRVFYSDGSGDVQELAFGADGTYLRSNGATSAPTFTTPSGSGDMLQSVYDTDTDSDIDVAAGGTEKSSWTQYCIPYLDTTTSFSEITIGTANEFLAVN